MSATANAPAQDRLIASAARILEHLGGRFAFRRRIVVKDPRRGSETWASTDEPIEARAHRFWAQRKKEGGVRERYERIAVEVTPFEDGCGLSDEWEVSLPEGWSAIQNVALSDDRTTWEADLCVAQGGASQ